MFLELEHLQHQVLLQLPVQHGSSEIVEDKNVFDVDVDVLDAADRRSM